MKINIIVIFSTLLFINFSVADNKTDMCPCTREFRPVCGSDGITYNNPCLFRCAKKKNPGLRMVKAKACDDDPDDYTFRFF